jgi:GPH family glycoside/pentoside/hexuronide:cation symporter
MTSMATMLKPVDTVSKSTLPQPVSPDTGLLRRRLFYGIGAVAFGVKDNGFQVLLLLYYNRVLGLSVALVGSAIMIAFVFDAFIDPRIGYWSDRVRSRFGRRHPFMYAAALPAALSYLLLFLPPKGLSQYQLFGYLLVASVLTRVCISCYEIPSAALAPELTSQYDERTSFAGFRYFFGWSGGLSMSLLAFSLFLHYSPTDNSALLDPAGFRSYGIAAALIMIVSTLVSAVGTQSAVRHGPDHVYYETPRINILTEVFSILRNRSAFATIMAAALMLLATGLSFALGTYFNIYAWGLTGREISIITAGLFVSAFFALLAAPWISRRYDKRGATLRVATLLFFLLPFPLELGITNHFPSRESGLMMPFLVVYNMAVTSLLVLVPILLSSMLADVVEEIEVQTGQRKEGVIYSINTFIAKWATGVAVFIATVILNLSHFPADTSAGPITAKVIMSMSELYVATVMALYAGSIICAYFYKISREQHSHNLQTLAERRALAASQDL